jgi:hypothetical protein
MAIINFSKTTIIVKRLIRLAFIFSLSVIFTFSIYSYPSFANPGDSGVLSDEMDTINMNGVDQARSVSVKNGEVILSDSPASHVEVATQKAKPTPATPPTQVAEKEKPSRSLREEDIIKPVYQSPEDLVASATAHHAQYHLTPIINSEPAVVMVAATPVPAEKIENFIPVYSSPEDMVVSATKHNEQYHLNTVIENAPPVSAVTGNPVPVEIVESFVPNFEDSDELITTATTHTEQYHLIPVIVAPEIAPAPPVKIVEVKPAPVVAPPPVKIAEVKPAPVVAPPPVKIVEVKPAPLVAPQPVKIAEVKLAPVVAAPPVKIAEVKPATVVAPPPVKIVEVKPAPLVAPPPVKIAEVKLAPVVVTPPVIIVEVKPAPPIVSKPKPVLVAAKPKPVAAPPEKPIDISFFFPVDLPDDFFAIDILKPTPASEPKKNVAELWKSGKPDYQLGAMTQIVTPEQPQLVSAPAPIITTEPATPATASTGKAVIVHDMGGTQTAVIDYSAFDQTNEGGISIEGEGSSPSGNSQKASHP